MTIWHIILLCIPGTLLIIWAMVGLYQPKGVKYITHFKSLWRTDIRKSIIAVAIIVFVLQFLIVGSVWKYQNNTGDKMDIANQVLQSGDRESAIEMYDKLGNYVPAVKAAKQLRHDIAVEEGRCLNGYECQCLWK